MEGISEDMPSTSNLLYTPITPGPFKPGAFYPSIHTTATRGPIGAGPDARSTAPRRPAAPSASPA